MQTVIKCVCVCVSESPVLLAFALYSFQYEKLIIKLFALLCVRSAEIITALFMCRTCVAAAAAAAAQENKCSILSRARQLCL